MAKLPRTDQDLIESLRKHVALLATYHGKAFVEGDSRYYGEVAGKLRLLIYRSRTCHPLLLDLMEKLGVAIRLKLNGPPTIDNPQPSADIDEYFSTVCLAFRPNPKDGLIEVTKMQIVRHWAQEIGASHEDPEVDEEFAKFLALPLFAYDQQASIRELQAASEFVLAVAEEFFKRLDR